MGNFLIWSLYYSSVCTPNFVNSPVRRDTIHAKRFTDHCWLFRAETDSLFSRVDHRMTPNQDGTWKGMAKCQRAGLWQSQENCDFLPLVLGVTRWITQRQSRCPHRPFAAAKDHICSSRREEAHPTLFIQSLSTFVSFSTRVHAALFSEENFIWYSSSNNKSCC